MADTVKRNTKWFVVVEDTEGTYKAPSAGSEAIQVLSDGAELTPQREFVDRNVFNGSLGQSAGKAGQKSVTGSIPVELKAGSTGGAEPEYSPLIHGALGGKRTIAADITASDADGAVHSASRIGLANADKNKVNIGDVIHVRRQGADEDYIGAVTAVNNVDGSVSVDVSPALTSGAFIDGDIIKKAVTYYAQNTGHPSLSVVKEVEEAVLEKGIGCKVASMSLNNFATGQMADLAFGIDGLTYGRDLGATGVATDFDTSTPPLILGACVVVDGEKKHVNEVGLSVENTLAFKTSTQSLNGRIASRITSRSVTGSIDPYKQDDDVNFFTKFDENTSFALIVYAYNPVAGSSGKRFKEVVGIYLPDCRITEIGEADQDGLLKDAISFRATRGDDASKDEIFVTLS